jgi:hypothetical protein
MHQLPSNEEIERLRDELIELGVDAPADTCCRQWKPVTDLIKTLLASETFNQLYVRRDQDGQGSGTPTSGTG